MERQVKECKKCHKPKPRTEFYHHPTTWDGYMHTCKDCWKDYVLSLHNGNGGKPLTTEFLEMVREYIKDNALTAKALALKAGLSPRGVQRLVKGQTSTIHITTATALLKAMDKFEE